MEYLDRLLERLTTASGVGYAGDAGAVCVEEIKKAGLSARILPDGGVAAQLRGSERPDVIVACHLDEIGFVVKGIDAGGFIRFDAVGSTDPRTLIGKEVIVHGRQPVGGYIGAKPPHLMSIEERNSVFPVSELFIDTGFKPARLKKDVRIGDMISFGGRYLKLKDNLRSAKALDDRAGVAAGIFALKVLAENKCRANVHLALTSQEEFSGLGAKTLAARVGPGCAVVIDATLGDQAEISEGDSFKLEAGPAILRGGTVPRKFFDRLVATAKELEIPYQVEALPASTGTDADSIAFSNNGIPCGIISIPVRYLHTPVEVVSLKDIERTARLVTGFIMKL